MKRTLLILVGLMLIAASLSGQGLKGTMMITGYGGYTLGFGDAFKDYDLGYYKFSSSAGITFGGIFTYFVSPKFGIGGELYMQSYKWESEYTGPTGIYYLDYSYSDSETKLNFLFDALYPLNYSDEKAMYLIFGAGAYDYGDTEIGAHGGIAYMKQLSPNIDLYIAPRFHVVFADETVMMVQITAGAAFGFGK
ncbi:MAG: hypothetical protein ABIJ61_11680 [bacterium]